jgi:hypothetical protein
MSRVLNFSQFIGESDEQKKIEHIYDKTGKEVERIIMTLSGSSSGEITRLVNKFVETYDLLKKAQEAHDDAKEILKDSINKSFKEEERFITRIIKTVKYALTFSKYTKEKHEEKVEIDYNKAFKEIMEVFPEIKEGLNEIIKNHTQTVKTFKKETSGAIKYSHIDVNEGITDILKGTANALKTMFASLYRTLRRLGSSIDKKFKTLDRLMKIKG